MPTPNTSQPALTPDPWLVLALCPELPTRQAFALVERWGSAAAVLDAKPAEWRAAGLTKAAATFLTQPEGAQLEQALDWLSGPRRSLLTPDDERFPHLLIETGEAPLCLFVAGDPDVLGLPQLAIVGSRNATPAGREIARDFAAHLARAGLIITSGLALGIDTAAHRGAVSTGRTIAVLGTGPDQVYPRENTELAGAIARSGAIVSEFAPGAPPRRDQFPRRNRIIAGLSLGVLVVEASIRSGSLITARLAGNYGREIFAVPGSIHNPLSKGCHQLIRQGAKLVESAGDIIEELASLTGTLQNDAASVATHPDSPITLGDDYITLLQQMGADAVSIERLASRSGLTAGELSSMLLILELEGRVVSLPGGLFQQRTG